MGAARCATPQEGCACLQPGQLIQCGEVKGTTAAGVVDCHYGYRRCESGLWSSCSQLQDLTPPTGSGDVHALSPSLVLPDDAGCPGDSCDPYCKGYPAAALPDAGLTIATADAGTGAAGLARITEAGVNVEAGIYNVLSPGQTAINPVNVTTTLNPVDVYFLFNSTSEMQGSFETLAAQMPAVMSTVEAAIPNTAFGLGRFTNYTAWPYASQQSANAVYVNLQDLTTNTTSVEGAFNGIGAGTFVNKPYVVAQSSGVALYSMALNENLGAWAGFPSYYGSVGDDYWYATTKYWGRSPLAGWYGYNNQTQTGCPGGTLGTPCFRSNAFHLVLLMQDSPMMNGPAGSFPYYQFMPRYFPTYSNADYTVENSWYWWDVRAPLEGGTSALPEQVITLPTATVGQAQTWMGSAFNNANDYQIGQTMPAYDPSATMKCTWNGHDLGAGPDAEFDFTVTAPSQRYWFDTVGSAYDTVLYIIDKSSGLLMGCSDDNFAWLSAGDIGVSAEDIAQYNSALVGTLPAGNYRLVLDQNPASGWFASEVNPAFYTGYQLNMWPDTPDPLVSGPGTPTSHGADASVPGYQQTLDALATPGLNAKVGAIDMSGVSCGQTVTSWENNFTQWSLQNLALDTGAVANGQPVVIGVKQDGSPGPASGNNPACPSAANLGAVVSDAIAALTNNQAQPVTAVPFDFDDATDYDGPPGGSLLLTPYNVDDATFVQSIVAHPVAGCTVAPGGTSYASCLPGAVPNFTFTFALPTAPVAVVPSSVDQIFYFEINLYGTNTAVPISTTPVVIVVPAEQIAASNDFYQEYGVACPPGYAPSWGLFSWVSSTPSSSGIDFQVAFAPAPGSGDGGINAAVDLSPPFMTAQIGPPNTDVGAFDLGAYAKGQKVFYPRDSYVRVHAHLRPNADGGTAAPTLTSMNLTVDCVPSE